MKLEFLTVDQLAKGLQIPKSWVYGKTRETGPEAIPRVKVGKYIRFVVSEVMDLLKTQNKAT